MLRSESKHTYKNRIISVEPTLLISIRDDVVILEAGKVTISAYGAQNYFCWMGFLHKALRGTSRSSSVRAEPSQHARSQRSLNLTTFSYAIA